MKNIFLLTFALATAPAFAADKIDPRLATAKTAYVFPIDPLKDDQPVAACLAKQLSELTPYASAEKAEADVLVGVGGNVSGDFTKAMGTLGTVRMSVTAQDGTILWRGGTALMTTDVSARRLNSTEIPCALATEIADKLRGAMRKSRDKK